MVVDEAGQPVSGVKVYWTAPGPVFHCAVSVDPLQSSYFYRPSGEATTNARGEARLRVSGASADERYQLLAIGPDGGKTLGSLGPTESTKVLRLLPVVRINLALRCGGGACGGADGYGSIVRDGGSCTFLVRRGVPEDVDGARLPQGDLELNLHSDVDSPREARVVYRSPLRSDLRATVELPIVGGPHELVGSALLPDGSACGGDFQLTMVSLECPSGLRRLASAEPSTGAFRLTALSPEPCVVSAVCNGREGQWLSAPVSVSPGSTPSLTILLEPSPP